MLIWCETCQKGQQRQIEKGLPCHECEVTRIAAARASAGQRAVAQGCHLAEGLPGVMRYSNARQICNRMIRVKARSFPGST